MKRSLYKVIYLQHPIKHDLGNFCRDAHMHVCTGDLSLLHVPANVYLLRLENGDIYAFNFSFFQQRLPENQGCSRFSGR